MKLDKRRLDRKLGLKDRVDSLERYLYRLVWDLEGILQELEEKYEKKL